VYTYISPGDFFVTNVKDANRLLKVAVVIVVDTEDKEILAEMEKHKPLIRDTIIFILRNADEETLRDTSAHPPLREMIRNELNEVLGSEHVVNVLFNDYVIQ